MFRRFSVITVLGAMALLWFNGGQPEAVRPLRIAVPFSVSSIPVMELDGAFIGGRRVTVSVFQDHSLVLAEFLRGDVDILFTGFTQGAAAFSANREVRHLATVVWGVSSIMVRDPAVKRLEELVGKSLAVPFANSPLDLQTRALLAAKGLTDKVTIEYAPPPQALALLLAGKLDAAALPEPLPSQLEAGGKATRLARYQDLWAEVTGGETRSPQVSLFARASFIRDQRVLIPDLMKALAAAVQAVVDSPGKAAAKHTAAFKLDPAVVQRGLGNTLFGVPGKGQDRALLDDYMKRIGLPPIDPVFFNAD
jgi:NitT/TauT family transport system substrate-binding protein